MTITVLVATHKKYQMPADSMYVPIQVGREGKQDLGYMADNTGDNISAKNPNYCELTAMYWAWKNLKTDYVGLAHYRRHFCDHKMIFRTSREKWNNIMTSETAHKMLQEYDVILPKKRHYWIETSISHYNHAHNGQDLVKTREIIAQRFPDYVSSFDKEMQKTASHRFNMFIMKSDVFHDYAEWLFAILFQLEKEIDISTYSTREARVFGFISERLLDVWLGKEQITYVEAPVMFMENQHWVNKIYSFLKRKFVPEVNR